MQSIDLYIRLIFWTESASGIAKGLFQFEGICSSKILPPWEYDALVGEVEVDMNNNCSIYQASKKFQRIIKLFNLEWYSYVGVYYPPNTRLVEFGGLLLNSRADKVLLKVDRHNCFH